MENIKKYVPSPELIFKGTLNRIIKEKVIDPSEIIILNSFIYYFSELKRKKDTNGEIGIKELKLLKELSKKDYFKITFYGNYYFKEDIEDEFINTLRSFSSNFQFVLITSDENIKNIAKLYNFNILFLKEEKLNNPLLKFFTNKTLSVHILSNTEIKRKVGTPEKIFIEKGEIIEESKIKKLIDEIIEFASSNKDSYIEKENENIIIAQLENIRVIIVKTPFSDNFEITAVKPVLKLDLNYYNLPDEIKNDFLNSKGVLISGAPGSGKTTFAQSLLTFLKNKEKIIKTIESPRDLQLSKDIIQLSLNIDSYEDIRNVLLLSRPDYSLFDEIRNPNDIMLFADLRLAGIGMIGVIHSTKPIDTIHRLIGKLELGIIPQVTDTIIFIEKGKIGSILQLEMKVKVPTGMKEEDLARPVIEVKDYFTKNIVYEIYTYGEQTMVIDLNKIESKKKSKINEFAIEGIKKKLKKLLKINFEVEIINEERIKILVEEKHIPNIIGKQGKKINEIEKQIGVRIDVEPYKEKKEKEISYEIKETKKSIIIITEYIKSNILIKFDTKQLKLKTDKKGYLKISKKSEEGKKILKADKIRLFKI